jgi:hypothetical protein
MSPCVSSSGLQVMMGHPSIMVTAHTYADLYGSDLDKPGPGKSHGAFEQSGSQ